MAYLVGKNIGRYHIVEKLGEGGMAAVYKAYDTRLERNVAIKVITAAQQGSEQFLKRFEREAKALAKLTHANIVSVIDYGDENGLPYLVMEYLPGGTLKQYIGKPIPFRDAARMLAPIAWALEYAHQRQIVHRDVKPANILLTETGTPMLSDFGIAKMLDISGATQLTATGTGIGTPDYMSPEQSRGEAVDHRADIYSLGIVFYEMVTGRRPFRADTPMAVIFKHATEPLPRPRDFVPDLPEEVESVLFKALTKSPEDRYQRMGDLANALESLIYLHEAGGPVSKITGSVPVSPSTGASGMKLTGVSTAPGERVTRTSPAAVSLPSAEMTAAPPQAKKFPWLWVGGGIGILVLLCVAAALVAGFWKPISERLGLAAASPATEATATTKPNPTKPKETPVVEIQPTQDTDCSKKEVICVGAMGRGPWDDKSFHESVRIGMERAAEETGILLHYYEAPDFQQAADILAKMADEKMDIIISVGYEYTDLGLEAATRYPNIIFIGIDQLYPEGDLPPNLVGVTFHEDQAGFLAGALAGMMSKHKSVGAVCGVDDVPPVWRYCEGFKAGALYVMPEGHVDVVYHPGGIDVAFNDPAWGAETAKWMVVEKNDDVIFTAAGQTGTGALKQAVELDVYGIGVDVDQYYTLPEIRSRLLSSAMKDISGSVHDLIRLAIKGETPGRVFYGGVLLAPYHDLEGEVPQDVKDKIQALTLALRNGQLKTGVPDSKDAKAIPTYRIATDPTYPPFEMIDDAGNMVGFDIDLMKIISDKALFNVQFVPVGFDKLLAGVANCEFDAAISAISWTPDREKVMLFSAPYLNDGQVLLVRQEEKNILGREDLKGKRVGAVIGSTGQVTIEKIAGAEVVLYDTPDFLIEDLLNKKLDAAVVNYSNALKYVFRTKEALKIVGDYLTTETYHIVACKNKPELIDLVNKGLEVLTTDGTIEKLKAVWLNEQK